MDKKEKARRARLWKCYRWTPEMYDEMFRLQNGKCYICGKPPKNVRLAVDHEHFKIETHKVLPFLKMTTNEPYWRASTVIENDVYVATASTKKDAIEKLKDIALPKSVRGLLCTGNFGCNKRLGRVDSVHFLEKALNYLKDPPAKKILDKQHPPVVASQNQLEKK